MSIHSVNTTSTPLTTPTNTFNAETALGTTPPTDFPTAYLQSKDWIASSGNSRYAQPLLLKAGVYHYTENGIPTAFKLMNDTTVWCKKLPSFFYSDTQAYLLPDAPLPKTINDLSLDEWAYNKYVAKHVEPLSEKATPTAKFVSGFNNFFTTLADKISL